VGARATWTNRNMRRLGRETDNDLPSLRAIHLGP
jgi:hypothetical protein